MAAYARQAQDTDLIKWAATEIKGSRGEPQSGQMADGNAEGYRHEGAALLAVLLAVTSYTARKCKTPTRNRRDKERIVSLAETGAVPR